MNSDLFSNTTLPGVPQWVIGTAAAQQAWELFGRSRALAWEALLLFGLIAFLLHLFGVLESAGESWRDPLGRIVIAAVLLGACPVVMNIVFGTGSYIAQRLFTGDEARSLGQDSQTAAQEMLNEPELPDRPSQPRSWLQRLASIIKRIAPGNRLITELALGIISIGFFIVVGLMAALWRCLVVIVFVTTPILIAMSVLPAIGKKISGAWIACLIQLSFWQVMTAILAALVAHTDKFLDPNSTVGDLPAVFFALAYTLLYLLLPAVVNWVLPISDVSSFASSALGSAAGLASGLAGRVAHVVHRSTTQAPKLQDSRRRKKAA